MIVLSLFDGISCGKIALERAGINVKKYYASEIDKFAIEVSKKHYPEIEQLGDVNNWEKWDIDFSKIDLLIGGSPCQGFSSSGKGLNFEDPRSKLFFVYVDILKCIKNKNPKVKYLLENVGMRKEWLEVINQYMGQEPIEINSSLFSAQNRVRNYWTNIEVKEIKDKNINLEDILEVKKYNYPAAIRGRKLNKGVKNIPITQCLEVRATNINKSNCITTVDKDNVLTELPAGRYPNAFKNKLPFRYYTLKECCRLQTVPDNYFNGFSENKAKKALGNGWTVDVIAHIFKGLL